MKFARRGISLIELLIAIALLGLIVMGFASVDLFTQHHVISSDRRAKLQNEVAYLLEHMQKSIIRTIGNRIISGTDPINTTSNATHDLLGFFVDSSADGLATTADHWEAYEFDKDNYNVGFYGNCGNNTSALNCTGTAPVIASHIREFDFTPDENRIHIHATARWDPAANVTAQNPEVKMKAQINMPSVSAN